MTQSTAIITAAVAVVTLILAIFGASWLNYQLLNNYIDARFDSVNARFDAVAAEFRTVRAEMETIRSEVRHVYDRFKPISGD